MNLVGYLILNKLLSAVVELYNSVPVKVIMALYVPCGKFIEGLVQNPSINDNEVVVVNSSLLIITSTNP